MSSESYEAARLRRQETALDEILRDMPPCIRSVLTDIRLDCRPGTVLDYARDTHAFLLYLTEANPALHGRTPKDISVEELSRLTAADVNEFLSTCRTYRTPKGEVRETGKVRLSGIRSSLSVVFGRLYTREIIPKDPVDAAARFRIPAKKTIDVLEKKEARKLLHAVETTSLDSPRAAALSKHTALRDTAIVTLLLNSGIRVAELVGLDLPDVDFDNGCIYILRKGGIPDKVYINDQTLAALKDYIDLERPAYADGGGETALFLSGRRRRMAVRSVQEMLKKYASSALPSRRHLSPHTLRRTYGTALYEATGDLKSVQAILGHTDVRTTSKYYVRESDLRKEQSGRKNLF